MSDPNDHSTDEGDSEEEKDGRDEGGEGADGPNQEGLLTSFLFGNIDSGGKLEESFLDEATQRHLGSLGSMLADTALASFVEDVKDEGEGEKVEDEAEEDFSKKADEAEDFSLISEMLDDDSSDDDDDDDSDEEEDGGEASKVSSAPASAPLPTPHIPPITKEDSVLMPPPPPAAVERSPEERRRVPSIPPEEAQAAPLAGMLPEKYKNANVKDFFPEFRENAVLRFSQLFPIKESHKPRTWKALRKRRAKEMSASGGEPEPKKKRGWVNDYAPLEDFVLAQCDSVRLELEYL